MQPRHSTNVVEDANTDKASPARRASIRGAGKQSQSPTATPSSRQKGPEKTVDLTFQQPNARSVCVAGTFNNWDQSKTPMRREGQDPVWKVSLPLNPRRYRCRSVVDG